MIISLIPLTLALCRFLINTAPKRPAPKRPAPKCPRAQTAAPKRRRPEVTYPVVQMLGATKQDINSKNSWRKRTSQFYCPDIIVQYCDITLLLLIYY